MEFKTLKNQEGLTLKIVYHENPESPRSWDNLGKMICFHSRYGLGDEHGYDKDDYNSFEELEKAIKKDYEIVLPLYLYDHSGITISTKPFSCGWDSGMVGFIVIDKKKILSEFGGKILTKKLKDKVIKILESEVKEYDQYLTGEVFGFEIEDSNGNRVDSCFGFFGDNFKENGLADHVGNFETFA